MAAPTIPFINDVDELSDWVDDQKNQPSPAQPSDDFRKWKAPDGELFCLELQNKVKKFGLRVNPVDVLWDLKNCVHLVHGIPAYTISYKLAVLVLKQRINFECCVAKLCDFDPYDVRRIYGRTDGYTDVPELIIDVFNMLVTYAEKYCGDLKRPDLLRCIFDKEDTSDIFKWSFFLACQMGHHPNHIFDMAVNHNIEPMDLLRHRNGSGKSPLHAAVKFGSQVSLPLIVRLIEEDYQKDEFCHYLIICGCRIRYCSEVLNAKDDFGYTPLFLACEGDKIGVVQQLIDGAKYLPLIDDYMSYAGYRINYLHYAVKKPDLKLVRLFLSHLGKRWLLQRVSRVPSESKPPEDLMTIGVYHGDSALSIACRKGCYDIAYELLQKARNLNEVGDAVLTEFLTWGKTLNCVDPDRSPLSLAAKYGHDTIVGSLLERDLKPLYTYNHLGFALLQAVTYSQNRVVQMFAKLAPETLLMSEKYASEIVKKALEKGNKTAISLLFTRFTAVTKSVDLLSVGYEQNTGPKTLFRELVNVMPGQAMEMLDSCMSDSKSERIDEPATDDEDRLNELYTKTFPKRLPGKSEPSSPSSASTSSKSGPALDHENQDKATAGTIIFKFHLLDDIHRLTELHGGVASLTSGSGRKDVPGALQPWDTENNCLKDTADAWSKDWAALIDSHVLTRMAKDDRKETLTHPVVLALLRHKWNTFCWPIYYFGLLIYAMFVLSLTTYVTNLLPPAPKNGTSPAQNHSSFDGTSTTYPPGVACLWWTLALLLLPINIARELLQIYFRRIKYLAEPQNYVEIMVYGGTILLLFHTYGGFRTMDEIWGFAAVVILCAWLNLALFLTKDPRLGIFCLMFLRVLKTLSNMVILLLIFLVPFTTTFNMLLGHHLAVFTRFWPGIVKVFVMTVGEMDFSDMFYNENGLQYEYLTYIIYVIFMCCMTIVFANLLIGLAVGDINTVREEASVTKLQMLVNLILEIEMCLIIWPNRLLPSWSHAWFHRRNRNVLSSEISLEPKSENFTSRVLRFFREPEELSENNLRTLYRKREAEDSGKRETTEDIDAALRDMTQDTKVLFRITDETATAVKLLSNQTREAATKTETSVTGSVWKYFTGK